MESLSIQGHLLSEWLNTLYYTRKAQPKLAIKLKLWMPTPLMGFALGSSRLWRKAKIPWELKESLFVVVVVMVICVSLVSSYKGAFTLGYRDIVLSPLTSC